MPRITLALPRCGGVIGAKTLGGVTEFLKIVGQNPRGDQHIHTRIEQILFSQTMALKQGQPGRVDLHQTDVTRAVGVGIDNMYLSA